METPAIISPLEGDEKIAKTSKFFNKYAVPLKKIICVKFCKLNVEFVL